MITYHVFNNRVEYHNENGLPHREDGPAVIWNDGEKSWWINGKRHRKDGPAYENNNGDKGWYINGKLHREDGPAVECNDYKEWWIDEKQYTEEEFNKKINEMNKPNIKNELQTIINSLNNLLEKM